MVASQLSYALYFLIPTILIIALNRLFNRPSSRKPLPPGPAGLPILGNLLALGARPHETITNLSKRYGPLMSLRLGSKLTIVASSKEAVREILQKNDSAFLGRPVPHAVTAERGYDRSMAWLSAGPKWKTLRKIANQQIFTSQRLDSLMALRHEMMAQMVKRCVSAREGNEKEVDIGKLVFGTTLNLLSNSMFSGDMLKPDSKEVEELKGLISNIMLLAAKPNLSDCFPILKKFDLQGIYKEIKISYDRLEDLIVEVIDHRTASRENGLPRRDDFLDVLMDNCKEGAQDDEFGREDMIILLADLFIGGTDTTTTTLEWAISELIRHPDAMAKVKQELTLQLGSGNPIKEKDIPNLPYLQSVLKESMRLHMTAPFLVPHSTMQDVEIMGYTIPKDTQVLVNVWALARDPANWYDPLSFKPERFLESDVDFRGLDYGFVPFGSGRRMCPGMGLGVRMLCLLLGSLVHHFEWKLPGGVKGEDLDMSDKYGITLQKAVRLVVVPCVSQAAG